MCDSGQDTNFKHWRKESDRLIQRRNKLIKDNSSHNSRLTVDRFGNNYVAIAHGVTRKPKKFGRRNGVYFLRVWAPKPVSPPRLGGQQAERCHVRPLGAETKELAGEACDGFFEEERKLGQNGEGSFEEPAVRAVPDPGLPTREERERHELSHFPFRPGFAVCVAV